MKSFTAILLVSFAALLFCSVSEGTSPQNPIEILNVQIGELELNQPTSVSVEVTAHIDLADVETEIVDGDGFTVITQTKGSRGYLPEGNTKVFNGIIEPTENGTWVVEIQASAVAWDSIDVRTNTRSVIYISDTLSASYTLQEFFTTFEEEENAALPASGSETIIYPEGSEQPEIPDSIVLFNDDSTESSRGTFRFTGTSCTKTREMNPVL